MGTFEQDDGDESVDLGIEQTAPPNIGARMKPARGPADLIVPILLGAVVIGVVAYLLMPVKHAPRSERPATASVAVPSTVPAITEIAPPKPAARSIFAEAKKPTPDEPPDPRKQTEEWKNVEEAAASADAGRALFIFEDFRSRNPGVLDADLKRFADATLDRLWWVRLADLCRRRDALLDEIEKLNSQIASEGSEEHEQKLIQQRESLTAQRESAVAALTNEMAYPHKRAPNVHDPEEIALLRRERNEALFRSWSEKVMRSARTRLGALPWERTR